MRRFHLMAVASLIVMMFFLSTVSEAGAMEGTPSMEKKIVLFHENVSWEEINQYAQEWEVLGAVSLMRLPLVHGLVLSVPDSITSADLANDPRVLSVEDNQKVRVKGQALSATADGGAADGGAADGGAADGGAADGGAADGGAADGGAADGGALLSPPPWSVIQPFSTPPEGHRPWGTLKLLGQLQDPTSLTDIYDPSAEPEVVKLASEQMLKGWIRVAIFDTGVDLNHSNLTGGVKGGIDLIHMDSSFPMDDNGHGTHAAGTLCAHLNGAPFGLVPTIELYAVKILDQYATGDLFNVVMGLQWAIDNDIDVVNMSIAYREDSPAIRKAIRKAYRAGLIMVAAAGNHSNWDLPPISVAADGGAADGGAADGGAADGGAADGGAADGGAADGGAADGGAADGGAADGGATTAEPEDDDEAAIDWYSVMYPARYREVIAVGASTPYGELTPFSNSSEELELIAPGTDIVSTNMGGGFGICSGTSAAAPHVTAAVVMMLALDPQLSAAELRSILRETAQGPEGTGEMDLIRALQMVWDRTQTQDTYSVFQRWLSQQQGLMFREKLKAKIRRGWWQQWKGDRWH